VLRTYASPQRDNWDEHLLGFVLSYNGTPHTATGFSPALLLLGYQPENGNYQPHQLADEIDRSDIDPDLKMNPRSPSENRKPSDSLDTSALELCQQFHSLRTRAKDTLTFVQASHRQSCNKGRLVNEFKVGDLILLNSKSLHLLGQESTGLGCKLLQRYDRPFEVMMKLSPVTYRIRLPSSYRIHPIINIAHLEPYHHSPDLFLPCAVIPIQHAETAAQEW
jgi:hypothetical protein